jgi:membrane protease YdiL (CAAX protease family)
VVWATWHFPFLAELSWVYTSESLVTFVPRLYLGAIAFSILYAELRVVTGSVWPAVLLHGVSNAFGHPLAANYLRSETAWLTSIGFDGLGMMILLGGMGVAMRTMRKRNAAGRAELQNEH